MFTSGSRCLSWYAARRAVVPLPHTLTPWLSLGRLWEAHQNPPVRHLQCCVHGLWTYSLEPKGSLILQSTLEGLLSHSSENKTKQKTCTHTHTKHIQNLPIISIHPKISIQRKWLQRPIRCHHPGEKGGSSSAQEPKNLTPFLPSPPFLPSLCRCFSN